MNIYCFIKKMLLISLLFFSLSLFSQQTTFDVFKKSLDSISDKYPGNTDTAIDIFNQMLNTPDIKNDLEKYSLLMTLIGREYKRKKNEVGQARLYYNKSLQIARSAHICTVELYTLTLLAMTLTELNRLDDKIKAYENIIEMSKDCPQSNIAVYVHTQLGLSYLDKNDKVRAEMNYLKADSILSIRNDVQYETENFTYTCLIKFYKENNNLQKTMLFAEKAHSINLKALSVPLKDKFTSVIIYNYSFEIFKSIGQIDSAIYYCNLIQQLSPDEQLWRIRDNIIESNKNLSELYEQKGDFVKALFFEKKYAHLIDSIRFYDNSVGATRQVKALEDKLALEKKQNEIKSQRVITWAISGLAAIMLIALGLFYNNSKKLKKLNITLEAQKQELTTLNEIRTKMFSIVSHDLLSPIGALKNMVELYQMKILSKEDFNAYTLDLKHNLNAIINNLNNILDWSFAQLKGKKPFIEPLNVYKIINDQLDLQSEVARQKGITLINNVPSNFMVEADFNQFSLIARNLINNALKYTPNTGKLEINASHTEGGNILEFRDNGVGMNEQKVQNLFNTNEKHHQSPNGKGLGLQMVKDFLEANNCTISVKSKEHEGSVFTLLFAK